MKIIRAVTDHNHPEVIIVTLIERLEATQQRVDYIGKRFQAETQREWDLVNQADEADNMLEHLAESIKETLDEIDIMLDINDE